MPTGWMPGVEQAPTAARGGYGVPEGGLRPVAVVCHVMEGWLATMRTWAKERPPQNRASYHFGFGSDGTVVQFVPITEPAWHAGRLDMQDGKVVPPTWGLWRSGQNVNAYTLGIAAEGVSATSWNEAQHASAARVLRWISQETGLAWDVRSLIGHYEVCPHSRAHDPGPNWDRERLIAEGHADGLSPEFNPVSFEMIQHFFVARDYRATPLPETATHQRWTLEVPK